MSIEPLIFFDMAASIFALSIALIVVVFYFSRIIKNNHQPQETGNQTNEARQKIIKIIDETNSKAIDILSKTDLSTNISSDNFNEQIKRITSLQIKEFEKNSSDFINLYNQVLQDLKSKNIEVFQNVSKNIELSAAEEIKNFKDSVEKLTFSSQKMVERKINEDYKALRTDIDNYKKEELRKIDDNIYNLLEKISKLALGKTLNLSDHEDLIQKSLEKAKREGVFGS